MEEEKKNETVEEEQVLENEEETVKAETEKKQRKKNNDITKNPEYIKLCEENAYLKDQLLRSQAEFENFRKRMNEEQQKNRKYALYDFLLDTIETLDIFNTAVNVKQDDEKLQKFLSGFVMINNRLRNTLAEYGVVEIDCLNKPFNPAFHDAMDSVEKEGVEPGIVVEVVMTGYMYKDRVLRPAMVKVSK